MTYILKKARDFVRMASSVGLEPISVSPYKQDPAWKYCQVFVKTGEQTNGVKVELKRCIYCGKMFQGGGIHRLKEHLAGRKGNGPICDRAPPQVQLQMQQSLDSGIVVSRRRKNLNIVNPGHSLSGIDHSLANQEQCKLIGVSSSDFSGNREAGGISSLSVHRRMRGRVADSSAVATGAGSVDNVLHLGGNPAFFPHEVDNKLANEVQMKPIGGFNSKSTVTFGESNSVVYDSAGNGTGSSDKAAPKFGETDNSFAEHTPHRLTGFPVSNFLVNQEEENGTDNTCAGKRKRGIQEISSASTGDGMISYDFELERADNQQIQMAIGRFLYEIGAPLDAIKDSVYFQPMIDAIASRGSGVLAPSYPDLRGWILKNAVKEVKHDIDHCSKIWAKTGCSLLARQWNCGNDRTLLNFAIYSPEGTTFFKFVDVSNIIYSADALYELLKQVVEEVGVGHVLQVITNYEDKYIVAGKRLMDAFPTLYWSPCAVDCIELMLEDFGKVEWINSTIEQAKSVTRYIYKHAAILNMMRRYTFGIDIVRPGVCLFATNFMTLKQMADLKLNLQSMVTSQEWMDSLYSKTADGLKMRDILTNRTFWSWCFLITNLTSPILGVLRIACNQKRAAMGYVFAGIYRAKEIIKRELVKKEDYTIYWNIIDQRWKKLWHLPLHAAGFYLNPKFFYSIGGEVPNSIMSGMFDCIERLVPDIKVQDTIIKEINIYKNAVGDLGRKLAIRARDTLLPGILVRCLVILENMNAFSFRAKETDPYVFAMHG